MASHNECRNDLILGIALSSMVGLLLGSVTASLFSGSSINPSAWAILAASVGGAIGFFATRFHDRYRWKRELDEIKASIYVEVADRSARCVSDYIHPWENRAKGKPLPTKEMYPDDFAKFRPAEPVVYRAAAAKLGLLDAKVLLALAHFYFRLDALCRALDRITVSFDSGADLRKEDPRLFNLINVRIRSTFEPALRALERLDIPGAAEFDREAAREYWHLRESGLTLREALMKYKLSE